MSLSQTSLLPRGSPYAPKAVAGACRKYQKRERNLCVFVKNRQYPDQGELKKSFNSRRHFLLSSVSLVVLRELDQNEASATPSALDTKMVGSYLPKSDTEEGFYDFIASKTRTPALRAGALEQYHVCLPPEWKEVLVSNAKSGNYCQPRCDEATTEVSFGSSAQGTLQVIIIPTTKLLIAKKYPTLHEVGDISSILNAISPAITGSVAVEEEDIVGMQQIKKNGRDYYEYELFTPYAEAGSHNLTTVCTSMVRFFHPALHSTNMTCAHSLGRITLLWLPFHLMKSNGKNLNRHVRSCQVNPKLIL